MRVVFADASYFVALLASEDRHAEVARRLTESFQGRIVTSTAVLTEVGNFFSRSPIRQLFVEFVRSLQASPHVEILLEDPTTWRKSLELYENRPDKFWSLTDCLSLLIMEDRRITEALTNDHHFEQAGYTILLIP